VRKQTFYLLAVLLIMALMVGCSKDNNPIQNDAQAPALQLVASAVPADAVIDSARFFMYVVQSDTQSVAVNQVNADWTEGEVTFNNFAAAFDTAAVATLAIEDAGWVAVDISTQVKGWFDSTIENYGFFIQPLAGDTGATVFASREADENQPYLEVYLTTHEGESMETLDAVADAYIYSADPDSNYGAASTLMAESLVDADTVLQSYQSLVRFEFPVEIRYTSIGDRVWLDDNRDGVQDEGEMGLAGVTVNLYDCEDNMIATTTTDENGMYGFADLMAGDYKVKFVGPENYLISPMDVGDDATDSDADPMTGYTACFTTLPGVDYANVDAGFYPAPAKVGDYVWNDENMNGLQDEGEMGMADIEVMLYDCDGNWLATTTTDENGMYLFDDLDAGSYMLKVVNPFGYILTYQDMGDDDSIDSDFDRYQKNTVCFTLDWGDEMMDMDAGMFAFDGCTYGKGYWKNHTGLGPQNDEVTKLLTIWLGDEGGDKSMEVTDVQMTYDVLQQHEYNHPSNGITKLYAHLLTAKLNIVNFANPEDIYETINDADSFLADHDWTDWDGLDRDSQKMVLKWKGMLEEYNEGMIGPGSCDEDEYDDGDDMDGGY